jgi:hypothetical protein
MKYSFQKLTQFSQGNNVLDAAASNIKGFFGEIQVLLQVSCIYLFGTNRTYLLLETPKLQEGFLSKTNSILTGKQCAWMLLLLTQMAFILEILLFLQLC